MILPIRKIRSPRLTMGQSLASIAVASIGLAAPRSAFRQANSFGDYTLGIFVGGTLVFLLEVLFWGVLVPAIPSLTRALGKPKWFRIELEVDPSGINWIDDRARANPPKERGDPIHWIDESEPNTTTRH
jgi:hypothetical protein